MTTELNRIEIYLEIGATRAFASALDWPGWSRSGRDEQAALQALLAYGPRYAPVPRLARLEFEPPAALEAFAVVEHVTGNASTDYGVPNIALDRDKELVDEAALQRFQALLQASWKVLDEAASKAVRKELRKGPRGGGRELEPITRHVSDAERAYLSRLGLKAAKSADPLEDERLIRQAVLEGLAMAARGQTPAAGPRGGTRWSARTFIRRAAWHVLDHAWEIEDRIV